MIGRGCFFLKRGRKGLVEKLCLQNRDHWANASALWPLSCLFHAHTSSQSLNRPVSARNPLCPSLHMFRRIRKSSVLTPFLSRSEVRQPWLPIPPCASSCGAGSGVGKLACGTQLPGAVPQFVCKRWFTTRMYIIT